MSTHFSERRQLGLKPCLSSQPCLHTLKAAHSAPRSLPSLIHCPCGLGVGGPFPLTALPVYSAGRSSGVGVDRACGLPSDDTSWERPGLIQNPHPRAGAGAGEVLWFLPTSCGSGWCQPIHQKAVLWRWHGSPTEPQGDSQPGQAAVVSQSSLT